MKITPLEIKQQQFEKSLRGYDVADVQAFLSLVSTEYEHLLTKNKELEEQIEAVHCYCGNGALKTPKITEKTSALRIVGDNFRKCNDFVSLFDRYVTRLVTTSILFC